MPSFLGTSVSSRSGVCLEIYHFLYLCLHPCHALLLALSFSHSQTLGRPRMIVVRQDKNIAHMLPRVRKVSNKCWKGSIPFLNNLQNATWPTPNIRPITSGINSSVKKEQEVHKALMLTELSLSGIKHEEKEVWLLLQMFIATCSVPSMDALSLQFIKVIWIIFLRESTSRVEPHSKMNNCTMFTL